MEIKDIILVRAKMNSLGMTVKNLASKIHTSPTKLEKILCGKDNSKGIRGKNYQMVTKITGKLLYVDYKTCLYLESLNLSYKEMCEMFEVKISPEYLCKKFKKFGIHHKCKCERIYDIVSKSQDSLNKLSRDCKVSKAVVIKARKKARVEYDKN